MKISEIINLDFTVKANREKIQDKLKEMKVFEKYSDEQEIPISAIEKAIKVMSVKYYIRVQGIYSDVWANEKRIVWNCKVLSEENLSNLSNIYGICIYEVLAKSCIVMYSMIKLKKVQRRKEDET